MKITKSIISWTIFTLFSLVWARFVFISLPTNPAFLTYAGVQIASISLLILIAFVPLFFFAFLISSIEKSLHRQDLSYFFQRTARGTQIALSGSEAISKSLIEMKGISYATQFFSLLPTVYQDFYESLRRILKNIVLANIGSLDKRPETQDLWVLCRQFLYQASRDPAILDDIRRSFKKSQNIAAEFANFKLRYDHFLKTLKTYDRDMLVQKFIEEGPLGQTQAVLGHLYTKAFEKPKETTILTSTVVSSETKKAKLGEGSLLQGLSIGDKK
ncbi:MAG: hypothetical protein ACTSXV_01675 [Alphaproteobacteria bacterium]